MDVHPLQPASLFHAGPGRPSAVPADTTTEASSAPDIGAEVRAALARSVAYQIIRTNLQGESRAEDPVADAEPRQSLQLEDDAVTATTEVSSQTLEAVVTAAASRATGASVRTLEVEAGDTSAAESADPLLLDLNGNGFETLGAGHGIEFDIDADGRPDRSSFATGGDAFLALDRNGNGSIDDGRELFGDQHGAANGYAELAGFDANRDGVIDARDPVFEHLLLVRAVPGGALESTRLSASGVSSISLAYAEEDTRLANGDHVAQSAVFTRADGSRGVSADLLVGFHVIA